LADPAPVEEAVSADIMQPTTNETLAPIGAAPVAVPPIVAAPIVELTPAPAPPTLKPAPALSIAIPSGPVHAPRNAAPVLHAAKPRAVPAVPETASSLAPVTNAAAAPATVAMQPTDAEQTDVSAVEPARSPKSAVATQQVIAPTPVAAPQAVSLQESLATRQAETLPAAETDVLPREAPAVANNPQTTHWRPFPTGIGHWPQPTIGSRAAAPAVSSNLSNLSPTVPPKAAMSLQAPVRPIDSPAAPAVAGPVRPPLPAPAPAPQQVVVAPPVVAPPATTPEVAVAQPQPSVTEQSLPPSARTSEVAQQPQRSAPPVIEKPTTVEKPASAPTQVVQQRPRVQQAPVPQPRTASQMPPLRVASMMPPSPPSGTTAAEASQQLAMISYRAGEHIEYGFNLAERGALYTAEAEFTQGLVLIAQALDAEQRTQIHSRAVAAGLRALTEADDFVPRNGQTMVRVSDIVAGHKTPVWSNARPDEIPPLVAMQRYYAYAQQQFNVSGSRVPAAAMALYGLGRLQPALAAEDSVKKMTAGPKAMALYHATLDIDPTNYLAANELGVLYGRYGQWNEAEMAIRRSIEIAPRPENWHNLADVLDRTGNTAGAKHAREQEQLARNSGNRPGWQTSADRVPLKYVDPETFIKASAGGDPDQLVTADVPKANGESDAPPAKDTKTAKRSYGWVGDKLAEGAARVSRPAKSDPEMVR
jgi:tetratricopeptide (TPR) repeat protein